MRVLFLQKNLRGFNFASLNIHLISQFFLKKIIWSGPHAIRVPNFQKGNLEVIILFKVHFLFDVGSQIKLQKKKKT